MSTPSNPTPPPVTPLNPTGDQILQNWLNTAVMEGIAVTLTSEIYWAAQPVPVQALQSMQVGDARNAAAMALATTGGYTIDRDIMIWGAQPVEEMIRRIMQGWGWVPSALQSPVSPPGFPSVPGTVAYTATPPAGSILVSVNAADYPPVAPPPIPPAATGANLVGTHNFGNVWYPGLQSKGLADGQVVSVDANGNSVATGGTQYTYHLVPGMMGASAYMTLGVETTAGS